jgi:hypothetical protein
VAQLIKGDLIILQYNWCHSIDDRQELKEVICVAVIVVQYQSSDQLLLQFYILPIIIPPALATAAAMGFR